MVPFTLDYLDHVALLVEDLEKSADWYSSYLGLQRVTFPEWTPFPVMLLAGNSGIALFPRGDKHPARGINTVDHFAFRLSLEQLEVAKRYLADAGLEYVEQDHVYFRSIYLTDPDGYRVELTAPTT
ncbi:VOC family protein [Lewinella sp. W8]|uniref:VOC family protein n=1 Tax=Lewinella sp. W8 TaxID=2528208 RepID=UPI001067EF92|nr:VOC family protein [Lewinella sp. W8]MTB50912.1 VOC family protein [Lewinella sp. W8]